jgi:hypothetical protein
MPARVSNPGTEDHAGERNLFDHEASHRVAYQYYRCLFAGFECQPNQASSTHDAFDSPVHTCPSFLRSGEDLISPRMLRMLPFRSLQSEL